MAIKRKVKPLPASEGSIPDDNKAPNETRAMTQEEINALKGVTAEDMNKTIADYGCTQLDLADSKTVRKFISLVRQEFNVGRAFTLTEFKNATSLVAQFISKNYKVTIEVKDKGVFEDD